MAAASVPRDVTSYGIGLAAPLALFFLVFFVAPLVQLFVLSLHNDTAGVVWGIGQYVHFLTDPFSLSVLGSTLLLGAEVTALCLVLGFPVAWLYHRVGSRTQTLIILIVLFVLMRWAFGRLGRAMGHSGERRLVGMLAAATAILFLGQHIGSRIPATPAFSAPVIQTYARQARFVVTALAAHDGSNAVAPSPTLNSDLSLVTDADVLLIFIESYGAVSYDRPEFVAQLAPSRARFEADIRASNRDVVSAFTVDGRRAAARVASRSTSLSGTE